MPRTTSQVTDTEFPFAEDTTPFVLVLNVKDGERLGFAASFVAKKDLDRGYATAWTAERKRELAMLAADLLGRSVECSLLAVWPGVKQSHVFLVDDLDQALAAL